MGLLGAIGPASTTHPLLRTGVIFALLIALARIAFIGWAAWADHALYLPGAGTGLLEHPGAVSVLFGDSLLIVICIQARRMSGRLGRKLPSAKPLVVRRYYRSVVFRTAYSWKGDLTKMFFFLSIVGAIFVANQTAAAIDPISYYGHDTFTSWAHQRTFWAVRVSLVLSWCIIVPYFASLLFVHCISISRLVRKVRQRRWTVFVEQHPDRCGGYAFFGWVDVIYASGILVVLAEAALLIMTHGKVTVGSAFALAAIAVGGAMISIFSIWEVRAILRSKERLLKGRGFSQANRSGHMTLDYAALIYGTSFSPYTHTAARLAISLRTLMVIPAMYRIGQLIYATT